MGSTKFRQIPGLKTKINDLSLAYLSDQDSIDLEKLIHYQTASSLCMLPNNRLRI